MLGILLMIIFSFLHFSVFFTFAVCMGLGVGAWFGIMNFQPQLRPNSNIILGALLGMHTRHITSDPSQLHTPLYTLPPYHASLIPLFIIILYVISRISLVYVRLLICYQCFSSSLLLDGSVLMIATLSGHMRTYKREESRGKEGARRLW